MTFSYEVFDHHCSMVMEEKYALEAIEEKWQEYWKKNHVFQTPDPETTTKPSFYVLEMFPYPSGTLHMGHARNYTIGDVLARYRLSLGYNVLHPMGWDACGLPAENAALKHKIHPREWTYENARVMKEQCGSMGFSHDWSREVFSCDPEYYKHEQKIFLDLLKAGLAYRKESYVNWDPEDHCVLANEQVIDGRGWRSGALVEKKLLNQWFFSITRYNEELLEDLKTLNQWPEAVKTMQENWIGRSEGCVIDFHVFQGEKEHCHTHNHNKGSPLYNGEKQELYFIPKFHNHGEEGVLKVFTTRPETLYGATFCALAWDHPLCIFAAQCLDNPQRDVLESFRQKQKQSSTANHLQDCEEKEGVFTGLFVVHPLLGTKLPLYAANYVRLDYGSGAVMGCPSHDDRDGDFAQKYHLSFLPILNENGIFIHSPHEDYEKKGKECPQHHDLPVLNGLSEKEGFSVMVEALEKRGQGQKKIMYRLKDWGIGRQRYWGVPIPIIYCPSCGTLPVPTKDLPVTLPLDVTFDAPGNPLERHKTWKYVPCPQCGEGATRETDTFDTFVESSWYFGRFCDPHNKDRAFDPKKAEAWLPVNNYVGGIEHAVLHLLYARFFTKALRDCGYWNISEPFEGLFTQGMVCHKTYKNKEGKWLYPEDVEKKGQEYIERSTGDIVRQGRSEKMSKSKNNVVGVSDMVGCYGADAVRLFLMSDTPPQKDFEWSDEGIQGSWRYVRRIWSLFYTLHNHVKEFITLEKPELWIHSSDTRKNNHNDVTECLGVFHEGIYHVTQCIESYALNKAVAHLRQLSNFLETALGSLSREDEEYPKTKEIHLRELFVGGKVLLTLLSPFMPHITQEIACFFGLQGLLHDVPWPKHEASLLQKDIVTIGVQVNGKHRGTLTLSVNSTEEEAMEALKQDKKLSQYIPHRRFIFIPGRMISIVI